MKLALTQALLFCLLAANARAEPRLEVALSGRLGQSRAPYVTSAFPEVSGYGAAVTLEARLRLSSQLSLGVRAPLVLARVEQPAGALYAEAAWANPELSLAFERPWWQRDDWKLSWSTWLALGAPLAEHDRAQLAGRALHLADAWEGFSEPELYTPGVLPVTPAGSVALSGRRWRFLASLKLPLLLRVSQASLPSESETRSVGTVPVAELEARWQVMQRLALAAAPRLTLRAVTPVDDQAGAVQLLAAGRAEFRLAEALTLCVSLQAPVAGPLGGTTVAGGLAARGSF